MKILFTHTNFPAQFRHLAEVLGRNPENQVVFVTRNPRLEWNIPGVTKVVFKDAGETPKDVHPYARTSEGAIRVGAGFLEACVKLRKDGFIPDVMVGHSGWGQTMFIRDVFPEAPFLGYFEWYYDSRSADMTFLKKNRTFNEMAGIRMRNTAILHDLAACAGGFCPTEWQKLQFPPEFHHKLFQMHDGINTDYFKPDPDCPLEIDGLELPDDAEIVTYCTRGMEPYRGFPQFYESLPAVLEARPKAHILIVGDDRICYSSKPADGRTYKEIMVEKVKLDNSRVHFTGSQPYGKYRQVLLNSHCHVYLTRPFVLSWSFMEAMSCGCMIVGSDTQPVREVMQHEKNGLLCDFHSPEAISKSIIRALEEQEELKPLREAARQTILDNYTMEKCLAPKLQLIEHVAKAGPNVRINVQANQQQQQQEQK